MSGSPKTQRRSSQTKKAAGRKQQPAERAARRAKKQTKPARESLLDAAAVLFGERGPAAVSTREVASFARVNNGLIHRHFGTKRELLHQTLERLAGEISQAAPDAEDPQALLRYFDATRERSRYWRLLARCLLDGVPMSELQSSFPTVRRIIELVETLRGRETIASAIDSRSLGAAMAAMGLGWLVFEPFLVQAAGLDDRSAESYRDEMRKIAAHILR
jgi:TetR/AcrR family transcriptional regulator, repressor for neighboring sulfatase